MTEKITTIQPDRSQKRLQLAELLKKVNSFKWDDGFYGGRQAELILGSWINEIERIMGGTE